MSYNHRRSEWRYFATEAMARAAAKVPHHYRVQKVDWHGPGWYYVETYLQRCPRNCCDDDVMAITPAFERARAIEENMRELASELRDARARCKALGPGGTGDGK